MTWFRRIRLVLIWLAMVGVAVGTLIWPWYEVVEARTIVNSDFVYRTSTGTLSLWEVEGWVRAVSPLMIVWGYAVFASLRPPSKWPGFYIVPAGLMTLFLWVDSVPTLFDLTVDDVGIDIGRGFELAFMSVILLILTAPFTIFEAFRTAEVENPADWPDLDLDDEEPLAAPTSHPEIESTEPSEESQEPKNPRREPPPPGYM